jgi:large conductance mechanosensitive channel
MRDLLEEFKAFALKGNLLQLAVAFVLGVAFAAVVTSFVNDIIMPIVGAVISDKSFANLSFEFLGVDILYGSFLTAVIYFLIVAWVLFLIVKAFNEWERRKPVTPTTKSCQYCYSVIPIEASRCPHCTSQLSGSAA